MPTLITIERAARNPALASVASSNPAYLAALISAASDAVRDICRREFALQTHVEYYSGGIYIREPLRLRQYPVSCISRVAASPKPALLVQNVDRVTNQRATAETTATGIRLLRVASAVPTENNLAYSDYPTAAAMASAINALGDGWLATVQSNFANWPSADFKPLQGAFSALLGGGSLEIYSEVVQPYTNWPLGNDGFGEGFESGCNAGWRLDPQTGELFGRFPRGQLNIRIDYEAGFATIPPAVQEACVQLAQDLYQAGLVNNTLKKATLGPSSVELKDASATVQASPKVQLLLAPYVDYAKAIFR